jgi:hypothetical protein
MRSIVLCALVVFAACGGGGKSGGDDDGGDDDGMPIDADNGDDGGQPPNDAPPQPGDKQIGSTCTPDPNDTFGQGDCPAGFSCLNLIGGTNPWCSKACTPNMDMCAQGYAGPGKAQCYITVTPAGGGAQQTMCGVVCDDLTNGDQICPASQCNGTCPGTLACTKDLDGQVNGQDMVVAKGCQ